MRRLAERGNVLGALAVVCYLAVPGWLLAQGSGVLEVGKFSAEKEGEATPAGWKPLTFKKVPKHTAYTLVKEGDSVVVKAVSEGAASGLTKEVKIDPKEYPIVHWRWKVENLVKKSDVTRKDGDDYPARLYVTFEYDADKVSFGRKVKYKAGKAIFGDIPVGALNYIWDAKAPLGAIIDNAYTDFAKMIIMRSGSAGIGTWVEEQRNVYEDYRKAFDEEPALINGVAIMSDTDNTQESAVAYFGDIVFKRAVQ
jgi:hypothetical protein